MYNIVALHEAVLAEPERDKKDWNRGLQPGPQLLDSHRCAAVRCEGEPDCNETLKIAGKF